LSETIESLSCGNICFNSCEVLIDDVNNAGGMTSGGLSFEASIDV
jgi:hypothetical protein